MPSERPYLPLSVGRCFLALMGTLYALVAVSCAAIPDASARMLGYRLEDAGRSEFLAVYGGGQLALGVIFLWPLLRHAETRRLLVICVVLHGVIALFRAWSFVFYRNVTPVTLALGLVELLIFFSAAGIYLLSEQSPLPRGRGTSAGEPPTRAPSAEIPS